jgi:hypothetical protein
MTEMSDATGHLVNNGEVQPPSPDSPEAAGPSDVATGARPDQATVGVLTPSGPPPAPAENKGPPLVPMPRRPPPATARGRKAEEEEGGGGGAPPGLRYCFTVDAPLRVPEPIRLAKGPEGTRINVVYNQNSQVTTDPVRLQKSWERTPIRPKWSGLAGTIVSGGDFYLVRTDGVLELDGRVTIVSNDGVIIEASYNGLVDLYDAARAAKVPHAAVEDALAHALPGDNPEHGSFGAVASALRTALATAASQHGKDDPFVERVSVKARQAASDAIASKLPDVVRASAAAIEAIRKVVADELPAKAPFALAEVERPVQGALLRNGRGIDAVETAITRNFRNEEFEAYENFLGGREVKTELPVQLSVSFETSSGPWSDSPDEDMSWVAKHYLVNQKKFWKYRRLVRNPFLGIGKLTFEPQGPGRIPLAKHIHLDVFEIDGSSLRAE